MKDPGEGATSRGVTNLDVSELDVSQRTRRTCSVDECPNPHLAKGFCSKHYAHERRFGTPHVKVPSCRQCGAVKSREDYDYELGNYCSRTCHAAAIADRRLRKRQETARQTRAVLEQLPPQKCGGCKAERPALDFLGVHGKHTKRCAHCRSLAASYKSAEDVRDMALRRTYGIGVREYDRRFEEQSGLCAICNQPETVRRADKLARLAVDHCHESGAVRGLLCSACNIGLGKFADDTSRLRKAIAYLELNND